MLLAQFLLSDAVPGSDRTLFLADDSHLDADKVNGNDGFLQRGQVGLVQRLPHHHFGRHVDEVHADGFRHKGEGARRSQVALNHLEGQEKQGKARKEKYNKSVMHMAKSICIIWPHHLLHAKP